MKAKLMIALTAIFSIPVTMSAEASPTSCKFVEEVATEVMKARQVNAPMSKLMEILVDDGDTASDISRFIIIDAYEYPAFSTDEVKTTTVAEFANKWYLRCVKSVSE